MGLYKLFSCNVEIQYKSCLFSKATFFTLITSLLTFILPFILAYRSRGFWLKSQNFFEQPSVHFTYEYLLIADTEDPSEPIVCRSSKAFEGIQQYHEEYCSEFQVEEVDNENDNKNDILYYKFDLNLPIHKNIVSLTIILGLDFQLKTVCPLQMQSLGVITKDFVRPISKLKFIGDLKFQQASHLPCLQYHIDTKYNTSLFDKQRHYYDDIIDSMLEKYFNRKMTTQVIPLHSRSHHGHTGFVNLDISIRVPKMEVLYLPSLLQELKWAWPQYLSIVVIFYWLFNRIKRFVFNKRLLMAWEVVPWKKT